MKRALFLLLLFPALSLAQAGLPQAVTGGINWLEQLTISINNLLDAKAGILIADGFWLAGALGLWRVGALITRWSLANMGLQSTIPGELFADLALLLIEVLTVTTILSNYQTIHQIPAYVAMQLATTFDTVLVRDFLNTVNAIIQNIHRPASPWDILGIEIYLGMLINMAMLDIAMFTINSFGFVMYALLSLFGPLFVPMFLTKHFSRWFWTWVDELVTYSMYRAISAGLTFIWANVFIVFFQRSVAGDYTLGNFLALLPEVLLLNLSFLYGMFKIPSTAGRWFGGAGAMGSEFASDMKALALGMMLPGG